MTCVEEWRRELLTLAVAALPLVTTGCLAVAAGAAAAGGAAVVVAYGRGRFYRDYPVGQDATRQAVIAALSDLQLPLEKEETTKDGVVFSSRTGDARPIHIDLRTEYAPLPSEGVKTEVGIRVDRLGDELVSTRVLDQIDLHLVAPQVPSVPGATTSRLRPVAAEITAPPSAPPPPIAPASPAPATRTPTGG